MCKAVGRAHDHGHGHDDKKLEVKTTAGWGGKDHEGGREL